MGLVLGLESGAGEWGGMVCARASLHLVYHSSFVCRNHTRRVHHAVPPEKEREREMYREREREDAGKKLIIFFGNYTFLVLN